MNNTLRKLDLALAVAVLVALVLGIANLARLNGSQPFVPPETRVERLLRTGVLSSAYLEYPPYFVRDPNTGQFSGIFFEVMTQAAQRLGLRVEWTEEVGYGTMLEGLGTRYDVIGCGIWPTPERARVAAFSIPVFFSPVVAIVRAKDHSFDADPGLINRSSVRLATIDGELSDLIASSDFPSALKTSLPQTAHVSQNLLNVSDGKADVTFAEPSFLARFLASNPGTLRSLSPAKPLRVFGNAIVIPRGDTELKSMLDVALQEMLNSGAINSILRTYDEFGDSYYPVGKPYMLPREHAQP